IGVEAHRRARRLAAQADGSDRYSDFQTDQMPTFVQARISAARIGAHHILLEAITDVLGVAFEDDEHAEADVVRNRATVSFERRYDFDLSLLMQSTAFGDRPANRGNVVDRRRRKGQSAGRRRQARRVAYGRALDRRLGAVEK